MTNTGQTEFFTSLEKRTSTMTKTVVSRVLSHLFHTTVSVSSIFADTPKDKGFYVHFERANLSGLAVVDSHDDKRPQYFFPKTVD